MPEFARGHHFHDRADGIGLPAADDLARHHHADRLVEHRCTAFAEHAHDVTFRKDAFDMVLADHQHGGGLPLPASLYRGRKPGVWFSGLAMMALWIEDWTNRHLFPL